MLVYSTAALPARIHVDSMSIGVTQGAVSSRVAAVAVHHLCYCKKWQSMSSFTAGEMHYSVQWHWFTHIGYVLHHRALNWKLHTTCDSKKNTPVGSMQQLSQKTTHVTLILLKVSAAGK
jgi:hypothetical protein